jgi:hypothetical protein
LRTDEIPTRRAVLVDEGAAPDEAGQVVLRQDLPRPRSERNQDVESAGAELDGLAAPALSR